MPSPRHCSAPPSIARSSRSKGSPILMPRGEWAARFVHWYNDEHRHSGIRYVTPAQRHAGQDRPMLAARHAVYQEARQRNPQRWSGPTRNWTPVGRRHPQSGARRCRSGGNVTNPAFQFDQAPAFPSRPGSARATARNAGEGRSGATRSHAQRALRARAWRGWRAPDLPRSEHRGTLITSRWDQAIDNRQHQPQRES